MKLDVIGEQFILKSQIDTITDQTAKLYEERNEYESEIKKKLFETEKKAKDTQKVRNNLEHECRNLESNLQREKGENYENKMTIDKG